MNRIRIEGDRIALREWSSDDRDAVYRLMGDPEVVRYLSWKSLTRAECLSRLNRFIFDQHCRTNREPLAWLGQSALAHALQRVAIGLAARPPINCDGETDCRRYRYYLAVELRPFNRVIGEAGFEWSPKDRASREAEVGYFLEKQFWGHGYATEAAGLVIDFAFATLGANQVSAACDPRNHASERVMRRCGLRNNSRDGRQGPMTSILSRSQWLDDQPMKRSGGS
jgi:RimJ/RimL family protein N-acetyltransferase